MTPGCPERRRLSRTLTEAVNEVWALRDQEREGGREVDDLSIRLDQARAVLLNEKRKFDDHVTEHGCRASDAPTSSDDPDEPVG
jgi:hypothetical protein